MRCTAALAADLHGAPRRASRLHRQRGLQRDGDSEQDEEHQARHRRNVRFLSFSNFVYRSASLDYH